jgi:hypothetical protein
VSGANTDQGRCADPASPVRERTQPVSGANADQGRWEQFATQVREWRKP